LQGQLANQAAAQQALQQNINLGQNLSATDIARQQQNVANALQNVNLQRGAAFDPFSTLLGQQYGMQTQNVGTNQSLFNQQAALAAGNLGYGTVQNIFNPFGAYPADVYDTNVNAVNAAQIAEANRAASLEAAKMGQTANYAQTLGTFAGSPTGQKVLTSIWDWFSNTRTPGT